MEEGIRKAPLVDMSWIVWGDFFSPGTYNYFRRFKRLFQMIIISDEVIISDVLKKSDSSLIFFLLSI